MKAVLDTRFFIVHFLAEDEETRSKTKKVLEDLQRKETLVSSVVG